MLRTNALTADRQSCQRKDGYVRRFTTQLSMAVIQATAATTPSPSPGMKEAVGKSTEWKWKLAEPSPQPLRDQVDSSNTIFANLCEFEDSEVGRHWGEGQMHSLREKLNPHNSSLSDVIQLAQRGDFGAFELIYRLHCRRVYNLCLRMAKDPGEAKDLTQEVFMQVFRKIHTFRGEAAFSSWLHPLTSDAPT